MLETLLSQPSTIVNDQALTAPEVARILATSVQSVYIAVQNNSIPHFHVGKFVRFDPTALHHWIKAGGTAMAKKEDNDATRIENFK